MPVSTKRLKRFINRKLIPEVAKRTRQSIYPVTPVITGNLRSTLRLRGSGKDKTVEIGGITGNKGIFVDYAVEVENRRNFFFSTARADLSANVKKALRTLNRR